jgi:hypothetical protein
MILHAVACGWTLIGCFGGCTAESWAVKNKGNLSEMSAIQRYVVAVYWSTATMSSVGYGDVHAHTTVEKLYALSAMLLGTLL